MTWLWRGVDGPRDIPLWAYQYLVITLKVDPDRLSELRCVEQMDFEGGVLVTLVRIFHPKPAKKSIKVKNFASLDQHPDLILYEGHMEKGSGRVQMARRMATH